MSDSSDSSMNSTHIVLEPSGPYCQVEDLLGLRFASQDFLLTAKQLGRSLQSGSVRTRFRGRGMEFEEVRHYQAGDDIRTIDWRVTARTQVPHTKLYREERERPVLIMLDQRAPMFFGSQSCFKSVSAAYCASFLSWAALQQNDRIGALIFSDDEECDIRPKRSRYTLLHILQEIEQFNRRLTSPIKPDAALPLSQRLRDLRRIAKPGSALLIISDFHDLDGDCEEQLYQLARHGDVTLIAISDPLEQQLPRASRLTISDGIHNQQLDTGNQNLRQQFEQRFVEHREQLLQVSRRLGIGLLEVTTGEALHPQLQRVFGKKKAGQKAGKAFRK